MNNESPPYLSTGDLSKAVGVGRETLRFYEEKGLVAPARRTPAGYRQYRRSAIDLIAFIKATQQVGFSLKEIQDLLHLRSISANTCSNVGEALKKKLTSIDTEIMTLQRKRSVIQSMVSSCCNDSKSTQPCTLLPCSNR